MPIDINKLKQQVGTPAHKLIARGANKDQPDVKKVETTEEDFIGQVAGQTSVTGNSGALDRAKDAYAGAINALPKEVVEAIAPDGVDHAIGRVKGAVEREVTAQGRRP